MSVLVERMKKYPETPLSKMDQFRAISDIVKERDSEGLNLYLSRGFDINVRDMNLNTVIHTLSFSYVTPVFLDELISRRLNLFALNKNGESTLHKLFLIERADPLIKYLLDRGLNLYKRDFEGVNTTRDHTIFTNRRRADFNEYIENGFEDILWEDAIKEKNYSLALSIIQDDFRNLGGFEDVFPKLKEDGVRKTAKRLYYSFALNNMFDEAIVLMEAYTQSLKRALFSYVEVEPYGFAVPLVKKDTQIATAMLEELWLSSVDLHNRDWVIFYGSILCDLNEDIDSEVALKFKREVEYNAENNGTYLQPFFELLTIKNPVEFKAILFSMSEHISDFKYSFTVGLLYLRNNDLADAEYMFMKTIEMFNADETETNDTNILMEAHILLNHLQNERLG